jgi:hypothetical protein
MTEFHHRESIAPLAHQRAVLSPSFVLIGAAVAATILLLAFRLLSGL